MSLSVEEEQVEETEIIGSQNPGDAGRENESGPKERVKNCVSVLGGQHTVTKRNNTHAPHRHTHTPNRRILRSEEPTTEQCFFSSLGNVSIVQDADTAGR